MKAVRAAEDMRQGSDELSKFSWKNTEEPYPSALACM